MVEEGVREEFRNNHQKAFFQRQEANSDTY